MYQVSDVVGSWPDLLFPVISEGSCSGTVCACSHSSIARRYEVAARNRWVASSEMLPIILQRGETIQPQSRVCFYPSDSALGSERLKPRGQTLHSPWWVSCPEVQWSRIPRIFPPAPVASPPTDQPHPCSHGLCHLGTGVPTPRG